MDLAILTLGLVTIVLALYMAFRITPLILRRSDVRGEVYGFLLFAACLLILLVFFRPQ